MVRQNNRIRTWAFAGVIAILILGSLLHFVFSWTNQSTIIGMIVPVNESVWEHLKMGYTALLVFSCFEYRQIKNDAPGYFAAKLTGILALELTILTIFYSYSSFTGYSILWIDILSFVAGVIICQFMTYKIILRKPFAVWVNRLGLAGIIGLGLLFVFFTFRPPHTGLFKDSRNNTYGINKEK